MFHPTLIKTHLTLLALFACAIGATAETPKLLWETSGLMSPESVVLDSARNEFFVSNMASHGNTSTPGDGFISRISAEGKIIELKWIAGLDNPKGLALANGHLYVGDDKDLVEIDITAGKIAARYSPDDGPGDFNDCTADANGNVYVCSGRLATVFRLHTGKFEAWYTLDVAKTGGLNGLHAEKDRLLLGGWSLHDTSGKEQVGHISTVAYKDQALGRLGDQPICHIDGLESDGQGGYVVTDWLTGDVLHVTADGKSTPIMKLVRGSADLAYLIPQQLLIIPLMNDNVLRAYRWTPFATK